MDFYLDFEKPIVELESRIKDLEDAQKANGADIGEEIAQLKAKLALMLGDIYAKLDCWGKTQLARHPARPHFVDYCAHMTEHFTPLAGDRLYGEDRAILGGPAYFRGRSVMIIGNEKGSDTASRLRHRFGMAMPEGYRKCMRLMSLAQRFSLPVILLVDTSGAYPGVGAEERGQAEAIAQAQIHSFSLRVPVLSVIIGEGGSGGAVAMAVANRVYMMENAVYSVISPEGCASILWRDNGQRGVSHAKEAANAMRISAPDLLEMGIIDAVIPEPLGGAHRDMHQAIANVGDVIAEALKDLETLDGDTLCSLRQERFLRLGEQHTHKSQPLSP